MAFNRISTIGRARFAILESHFGDLETAWRAGSSDLAAAGLDQRSVRAIVSRRPSISPDAEWERLEKLRIDAITVRDPAYPGLLREVYDYPPVLYVKGNILPEDGRSVTIVGTRKTTSYGREVTRQLAEDLSKNSVTIVSGLARASTPLPIAPPWIPEVAPWPSSPTDWTPYIPRSTPRWHGKCPRAAH